MVTLQSVHGHTGLTHHYKFLTFWHSPRMSKINNDGLDQCGTERSDRLTFATVRKSVGLKGLKVGLHRI